ncbi:MAG: HlyD family efflux transporter periplasmic adaptor subunit [Bacteroidales bacterium]
MKEVKNSGLSLLIGLGALLLVIIVLGVIGYAVSEPHEIILQGSAEATEYRVSGKVPGRIEAFLYKEGDMVQKGDTLVLIDSPEVRAKLAQANAAHNVAQAQNKKAIKGARVELVQGAYEMWQKALVGVDIAKKSYDRVQNLYKKEVVSAQKRDEAEALYNSAVATEKAAKSQYEMAKNGAQAEDKEAARAMVDYSESTVNEVRSYLSEISLVSPITGEITEVFPKAGELVGQGAPIMTVTNLEDMWLSFSIREDLLKDITVGKIVDVKIPALGETTYKAKVTFLKAMASYATWRATKVSGQFDARTFEVRATPVEKIPNLRPGMSAIIDSVIK